MEELPMIFNRAFAYTFCRTKLMIVSIVLAICGILFVFFRGIALQTGSWVNLSLTFLPFFICVGFFLSLGVILTRTYHDEVKQIQFNYRETFKKSWELIMAASYFGIAVVLCFLVLWITLGVFLLLKEIPAIGDFFGVILSFAPFLINLGTILLSIFCVGVLFFVTPPLSLRGMQQLNLEKTFFLRVQQDVFSNFILFFIALFPLLMIIGVLSIANSMTGAIYLTPTTALHTIMQTFFIMIPFAALLSPGVVFFFHFAAESYVYIMKKIKQEQLS